MVKVSFLHAVLLAGAASIALCVTVAAEEPPGAQLTLSIAPSTPLPDGVALDVNVRDGNGRRFATLDPEAREEAQRLELEIAAGGAGAPVDVAIASRATLGPGRAEGRGSEVRVGRGLAGERSGQGDSTYVFVASDNEALTWRAGQGAALQGDRIEVGDLSAGVTMERNGVQASLAYVERSESTQVGGRGFSQDQSFTGVTVTVRH